MTIHDEHPFLDPVPDDVRRLRGRVGATVSLWTAGEGIERAGLTVSSYIVVAGETGRIVAALDPDADLTERLQQTGTGVVQLLGGGDRQLAEVFAGLMPAPGGAFRTAEFGDTPWGPRLERASTWAGVRLESVQEVGWSALVTVRIETLTVGDGEWLVHRHGRYSVASE